MGLSCSCPSPVPVSTLALGLFFPSAFTLVTKDSRCSVSPRVLSPPLYDFYLPGFYDSALSFLLSFLDIIEFLALSARP